MPFGFGLSIDQIMNSFNISQNGTNVAGLSTPLGASSSSIKVLGPKDTEGTINITITDTALQIPEDQRTAFSQFSESYEFYIKRRSGNKLSADFLASVLINRYRLNRSCVSLANRDLSFPDTHV